MKKNKYMAIVPAVFLVFLLSSCDKYLDIEPKGQQLLETVEDYDLWLDNETLHFSGIIELSYFADHRDYYDIDDDINTIYERAYVWADQLTDNTNSSPIWSEAYSKIYYYNAVIQDVDDATEGTDAERESLKAEALLGRALIYLDLTNLYGKVYNEETASEDLAVPFVTSVDVTEATPDRSTVQKMYDHILTDITDALPGLPDDNSTNRYRGSTAAGYALLARTYLYMGNYTLAEENAQLALDNGPNEIYVLDEGNISDLLRRRDAILSRRPKNASSSATGITPSLSLLQAYDTTDLRLSFRYEGYSDYSFTTRGQVSYDPLGVETGVNFYSNWGIDVAEMYLIIAEADARNNKLTEACDNLNTVREKRFEADDFVAFESVDQEEVLEKVLLERELEFPFSGLRWFDMRRMAAEGRMETVYRYNAAEELISTLEPTGDRYVLQVPNQILSFNPGWTQNP
ncbi:RagB/SusD family nutrient uptake outer membrane protein [Mangrovibacterium diazotrophicum]|uniref:SusD-like starch-binding protein associating with outer membrane n=1 Tax=Mangrovibacterium diazotrophicum TaxID=1261403 RepID=A0A419W5Y6_9BACT|nr:RagB/SusD family nutrient uptake outer membrane protein [Mangrovibacterium diazotrophicum]RKD90830.1 SusD-like starch-binding protein associating with outer membrane [Mangrovibacterium diazotrophicum]